jgi:hypothetical protein
MDEFLVIIFKGLGINIRVYEKTQSILIKGPLRLYNFKRALDQ